MAKKTVKTNSVGPSIFDEPELITPTALPPSNKKKYLITGCIALITIFILGVGLYYFIQYQHNQTLLKNPVLASQMEQEAIVSKVSKLTQLPTGEQPTIAKVTDITKLQDQEFFKDAKNGDMVLIYTKAKRIILYDPIANKVVQADTFATSDTAVQGAATSQAPATPITIAIYNGTTTPGLAKKTEQQLTQAVKNVSVVAETNAAKQDYPQTLVVDLTGTHTAAATQLASVLQGTVGSLPSGEVKPANADILVVLGKKD